MSIKKKLALYINVILEIYCYVTFNAITNVILQLKLS